MAHKRKGSQAKQERQKRAVKQIQARIKCAESILSVAVLDVGQHKVWSTRLVQAQKELETVQGRI